MNEDDTTRPAPGHLAGGEDNESVLNQQPALGRVGKARSSGGAGAAAFIREGMRVIDADGELVGTVACVEDGKIRLEGVVGPTEGEDDLYVPLLLVDGVDDERVILAQRGDACFGLGAEA